MMMVVVVIPTQTICDLIVQEYRNNTKLTCTSALYVAS